MKFVVSGVSFLAGLLYTGDVYRAFKWALSTFILCSLLFIGLYE